MGAIFSDNPYVIADEMIHPLLKRAVPNDLNTDKSILITGSNASGKSTYLKTADSEICSVSAVFVVRKEMRIFIFCNLL